MWMNEHQAGWGAGLAYTCWCMSAKNQDLVVYGQWARSRKTLEAKTSLYEINLDEPWHTSESSLDIQSDICLQCWSVWNDKVLFSPLPCMNIQVEGVLSSCSVWWLVWRFYFKCAIAKSCQIIIIFLEHNWCHYWQLTSFYFILWLLLVWWSYPHVDIKLRNRIIIRSNETFMDTMLLAVFLVMVGRRSREWHLEV